MQGWRVCSKHALLPPGRSWGDAATQNMTTDDSATSIPGRALLEQTQCVTVERHSCKTGSNLAALIHKGEADLIEHHCNVSRLMPVSSGHAAVIWVYTKVGFQQSVDEAIGLWPQHTASKRFNEQLCIKAPSFWAPQALLPLVLAPRGSFWVLYVLLMSDDQKLQRTTATMSSRWPLKANVQEGKYWKPSSCQHQSKWQQCWWAKA